MALALLGGLSTAAAQWIAFNDHYQGAQSHPRATFYVLAGNASFGPLRNLDTGNNLGATLSITNFNCTDSGFGAAFTGGPALATFGGFVDFTGNNIQLNGTNGVTGHTLSNLRTDARYNLKGTSNRGHASYTGRWTLFELVGAASFRNAHSAGCITNNPANGVTLASNQVAICTGINTATGAMFDWQDVDPGPDGKVTIISRKYLGPVPGGANDLNASAYCIAGLRIEETIDVRPPQIDAQPASLERCPGGSATFSVAAQGGGTLSYRWEKVTAEETNTISGATSFSYTLAGITTNDVAGYRVAITNAFGSVTSEVATLVLANTPVSIVAQPQDQTNHLGDTAQFMAVANAGSAQPVAFQWFRHDAEGNWTLIANATNATLAVAGTPANATSYYAQLQNCINTVTSAVATLYLETKPLTITNEPQDTRVVVGNSVTLSVGVDGTAPIYQWFKNGGVIAGATNATLTMASAQFSDTALYFVAVSNAVSAVTSRYAILSVVPPPFPLIGLTNHFWRYHQEGANLGTAWRERSYSAETNWLSGRGVLAREDNAAVRPLTNTVLSLTNAAGGLIITYYFRTHFMLTNEPGDVYLVTSNLIDDGAVVYANGAEAYRVNMGPGPVTYQTLAGLATEGVFITNVVPGSLLRSGTNVLAVEVHQNASSSSDVVMGLSAFVHFAPQSLLGITAQPQPVATDELRPVSFSIAYTGTSARVQWFKQTAGAPEALPGATATTLTIARPIQGVDDGAYFAIVTNAVTMIASETATLVITQAPPTIGSHPHPQKICPGEPLWLEVSAYGSAANRFQWQRNGTAIPGGTNNGLSILATTTNDSGSYSVVVSNALGVVTSAAAPVEISLLPFILAQSDGEGAGVGATAQFGVIAGGCGPFAYQWQFNGTNIKGATNASLVLTNVQLTDEGLYRVLVGNAHGVVASDAAMLAVSIGAAVNLPEATWSVASGQWLIDGERTLDGVAAVRSRGSQSELAVIVNGPARLRFWLYIAPNTIARFQINGRTQVQWLSELPWTPFEFYIPAGSQVLSWEASGSPFDFNRFVALDQVSLTTNELGPVILSAPQNVAVPAGSNFAFAVTAEGFPPFHYQWQRNGVDLPGANLSVLAVENAQLPHGGDYLVIVSNEFGTATAAAALEVMASAPTISSPTRVLAVPGHDVILNAQARGSEPLHYQWVEESVPMNGATNALLVLPHGPTNWPGRYSVLVSNALGAVVGPEIEVVMTRVSRVVHISMDGLSALHLFNGIIQEPQRYPAFQKLIREGAFTLNARCDYTDSITVPNHLSMLTGRPVRQPAGQDETTHHGYTLNSTPLATTTVHNRGNTNAGYIASVFDVIHDRGGKTAFLATKTSLSVCTQSYDANNGALDLIPPDDGRNKVDFVYQTTASPIVVDVFLPRLNSGSDHYAFLHFAETDTFGHTYGWGSAAWFDAVEQLDAQLHRVLTAIETNALPGIALETAVIVTADHGGEGTGHLDPASSLAHTVPIFVWGPGFSPRTDLYQYFANRADPGRGYPDSDVVWQPLRNGDTGNLALGLLGLPPVPGSFHIPLRPVSDPALMFRRLNGELTLEWSAAAASFALESAATPEGEWLPVNVGITTNLNTLRYSAPAAAGAQFFRLRR